jgi:predicted metal-dependent hydrolase
MRNCTESPSRELLLAISQFNSGEWFECHETLEELWIGETGEVRDFYQGILQVGVALHHWRNGNFRGAVSLFESGTGYLRKVPPVCQRVAVSELIQSADKVRVTLVEFGPNRMAELDPELIPKVRLV